MKILFIIPPYRTTDNLSNRLFPMPLASVTLGTILQNKGHEVVIKDFLIPKQKHKTEQPEIFKGKYSPGYYHYGIPMEECIKWIDKNINKFDVVGLCMCQCNLFETSEIIAKHMLNGDVKVINQEGLF